MMGKDRNEDCILMAEDIRIEVKMKSRVGIFILVSERERGGGNLKPLMPLTLGPSVAPAVDRVHSVAKCQKKWGPKNQMSGWTAHWVNPSLLGML